jgi:hypothetical protein
MGRHGGWIRRFVEEGVQELRIDKVSLFTEFRERLLGLEAPETHRLSLSLNR